MTEDNDREKMKWEVFCCENRGLVKLGANYIDNKQTI